MIALDLIEISKIDTLRLIHLFVCVFGAIILLTIWYEGCFRSSVIKNDLSLVFVSVAFLLWGAMDLYRLLGLMVAGQVNVLLKTLSAYNNALFLVTLPMFRYVYSSLRERYTLFGNTKNWIIFVFTANVFIVMLYTLSWGAQSQNSIFVKVFDVLYSCITFLGLGYAIVQTFRRQHFKRLWLSNVSIFVVGLLVIPQLLFLPFFDIKNFDSISVLLFCSHISLIYLFIVLTIDWMNEEIIIDKDNQYAEIKSKYDEQSKELERQHDLVFEYNDILKNLREENDAAKQKIHKIAKTEVLSSLTDRELQVLSLINKTYTEISVALFISKETVISHKKNIEAKLNISGKENLVELATICELLI